MCTMALAFRRSSPSSILKALAGMAGLGLGAWWAYESIAPLRARFQSNDNSSIFGVNVGTTGRSDIWAAVIADWHQGSAAWGRGPGTAEDYVTTVFGAAIGHPHNEFLRVLHDYGWVGFSLLVVGMAQLGIRCYTAWRTSAVPQDRAVHRARPMLSWVTLLGLSLTFNVTIFVFVMSPLGVIFGMSLGRMRGGLKAGISGRPLPDPRRSTVIGDQSKQVGFIDPNERGSFATPKPSQVTGHLGPRRAILYTSRPE